MGRKHLPVHRSLVALAVLMLAPTVSFAQSAIAGVVKDTTGAVLPGVTVEAASPALIERVRTVVSGTQGLYTIVDLRPGTYTVTFTLPGFSTIRREGIELTTGFTASVNAELRVGSLEESITVTGQSPVVDVRGNAQQTVITADVVDALPTARTMYILALTIPGMVIGGTGGTRPSGQDVGGTAVDARQKLAIHGSRTNDMNEMFDGIPMNTMTGTSSSGINFDPGGVQEFSYETGANSAERTTGGVIMNVIPKEGGNRISGTVFGSYTNLSMTMDNSTDTLRARGLPAVNQLDKAWDLNPSFGGPIKQDRLWFYASTRFWGTDDLVAGMWYDTDPLDFVYTPDLSRRAVADSWNRSETLRLTWQAAPKHKLSGFVLDQDRCVCHRNVAANTAPEAASWTTNPKDYFVQLNWSAPLTNRLLLEGGVQRNVFDTADDPQPDMRPDTFSVLEQSTNLQFRAAPTYGRHANFVNRYRAAASYVTGSHAVKVGFLLQRGRRQQWTTTNGNINLTVLNGVPRSITVRATPFDINTNMDAAHGFFAQDQMTIKRLTVNGGLRFDYHRSSVPEQHLPAVQFVGPRDFAPVPDVPNWKDLSPRLGASYDLFGTGKTALKVTLGRYLDGATLEFGQNNNPVNTSVNSANRTWTDRNGDFIPQESELGPLSNAAFGTVRITTRYDDAVRQGFGSRNYNWETSAGIQHELLPRMSVSGSYHRRSFGNFVVTDNLAVSPTDYDPYCIAAPLDPRLPGGGGNQICGLYDLAPAKFGQVNNLVTFADNFGRQSEVYNGVDFSVAARPSNGVLLSGGLNTGRTATNNCFVVDSPAQQRFCDVKPPFQTQIKFLGSVALPWALRASATLQSLPGPEIRATYVATNAQIAPTLGRNLSSGANGTATIELTAPGTAYDTRLNQLDARLTRTFTIGRTKIQGMFDLYNALNASPVLVVNSQYGPAWRAPIYILPGRLFKFGAQLDF